MSTNEAEFVNQISDVLCGHRGAPESSILARARELADLEQTGLIGQSATQIREAAQALIDVIDDASHDDMETQKRIAALERERDHLAAWVEFVRYNSKDAAHLADEHFAELENPDAN